MAERDPKPRPVEKGDSPAERIERIRKWLLPQPERYEEPSPAVVHADLGWLVARHEAQQAELAKLHRALSERRPPPWVVEEDEETRTIEAHTEDHTAFMARTPSGMVFGVQVERDSAVRVCAEVPTELVRRLIDGKLPGGEGD